MKGYNWKKGIGFTLIGAVIGLVVAGVLRTIVNITDTTAIIDFFVRMAPSLFVVASVCGVVGIIGYFYFNSKLKADNYRDEEGSFYEKHERSMSVIMSCATLCAVFNFTALGVNSNYENIGMLLMLIINMILSFLGEVANISLIKKVRPELDADPMDMGFKKDFFDKMDECEKNKAGKACFKTTSAMTIAYLGVFLACYLIIAAFDVSPIICLPVGILWFIQVVLMTYYSNKN